MDITHILEELAFDTGDLPREAIESAIAKREEITPHLLQILRDASTRIDEVIEQDNYQGHLYAMYLLAQFREVRAYPLIVKLSCYPGELPHAILGDVLTEDLSRILASVSRGDTGLIKQVIEDRLVNEYVRAASLMTLVTLVGAHLVKREEVIEYFLSLFQEKLEKRPSFVWDNLVLASLELHPGELYEEIKKAYDMQLIDLSFINPKQVDLIAQDSKEHHLKALVQKTELIEDTVAEMEKWISLSNI
jgi:hypothetical protein